MRPVDMHDTRFHPLNDDAETDVALDAFLHGFARFCYWVMAAVFVFFAIRVAASFWGAP